MRRLAGLLFLSLSVASFAACSSSDGNDQGVDAGDTLPFQFVDPTLDQLAPQAVSLGEQIQVFGADFAPNEYVRTVLVLDGSYVDETGAEHPYSGELELDIQNSSVAHFQFDSMVFMQNAPKIGEFRGEARIVSTLRDQYRSDDINNERSSTPANVRLAVKPSIDLLQLRSVSEPDCAAITKATVGGQQLGFSVGTFGLGEATETNPIRFKVTFISPTLNVVYVKDDGYDTWPIPSLEPAFSAQAAEGESTFEMEITSGNRLDIDPSYRRDRVRVSPPVQMGQGTHEEVLLGRFGTNVTDGESTVASILVEAIASDGTSIERLFAYDIKEAWEIQSYNQNIRLMERSDAIPVSGCFPGGDVGRDLTYTEGSSETRSRSLSFRWDRNIANSLGVNAGVGGLLPVQISVNASTTFSETFGVDINETVSSETHVGVNFSARIIPGYFGMCFRQVDRLQREVDVVYTNACGVSGIIGQTLLSDWNFGFDIATGPDNGCAFPSSLQDGASYEPDGIEYE